MSNRTSNSYQKLKAYRDDLAERFQRISEWRERHPDWNTEAYLLDEDAYVKVMPLSGLSSFDPLDLPPSTCDVLTSQMFFWLIDVATAAYEDRKGAQ
jgi:hypothetical protein